MTRKLLLVPIESFAMSRDRLEIPEMTAGDLHKLAEWDGRMESYASASADSRIRIPLKQ